MQLHDKIENKMLPCSMQTGAKKKHPIRFLGQLVELIVCFFDVLAMFCMHGVEVKPERPD